MQKVEGSSPFSRFSRKPRSGGVFLCPESASDLGILPPLPLAATNHKTPRLYRRFRRRDRKVRVQLVRQATARPRRRAAATEPRRRHSIGRATSRFRNPLVSPASRHWRKPPVRDPAVWPQGSGSAGPPPSTEAVAGSTSTQAGTTGLSVVGMSGSVSGSLRSRGAGACQALRSCTRSR
jgi:hypothetical protein